MSARARVAFACVHDGFAGVRGGFASVRGGFARVRGGLAGEQGIVTRVRGPLAPVRGGPLGARGGICSERGPVADVRRGFYRRFRTSSTSRHVSSATKTRVQLVCEFTDVRFFDDVEVAAGNFMDFDAAAGQSAPAFNQIN